MHTAMKSEPSHVAIRFVWILQKTSIFDEKRIFEFSISDFSFFRFFIIIVIFIIIMIIIIVSIIIIFDVRIFGFWS